MSSAKLNTSDLPRSLPSSNAMSPALHDNLSFALIEAGSIPAIEKVLTQTLAESGWTTDLRAYIQKIVRSGETSNYNEIMEKVLRAVKVGKPATNGTSNGGAKDEGALKIPERTVVEGVKVVRREIERVVTVVVDD